MTRTQIVLAAALALTFVTPAAAQTPATQNAAAAKPQAGLGGPVIPGVCLMSREAVLVNSTVGKAATTRLQELAVAAEAEVETQRKPLEIEATALQKDQAKLTAEQRTQRQQALAQKLQTVQALADQRNREIEVTRQKVLDRISGEVQTVIASVYKARNCGLLVDRNSVLGGNLANDLTAPVVEGLNAKMSTISFEREVLPTAAAQ